MPTLFSMYEAIKASKFFSINFLGKTENTANGAR